MDEYEIKKELEEGESSYNSKYLKGGIRGEIQVPEQISAEVKLNNWPQDVRVPLREEEKKQIVDSFRKNIESGAELDEDMAIELNNHLGEFELEV